MNIENLVEFLNRKHDAYLFQGYKSRLYQVADHRLKFQVNLFECKDLKSAIELIHEMGISLELELCTSPIYLLKPYIEGEPCIKRLTIHYLSESNEYSYEEHKEGKMKWTQSQ